MQRIAPWVPAKAKTRHIHTANTILATFITLILIP